MPTETQLRSLDLFPGVVGFMGAIDVLAAQTSLTEARSTTVLALRDYEVARVRMERAIGLTLPQNAPQAMSPSGTESGAMKKEGVTPARSN